MLFESQKAVINLFNDCYSIVSEGKYKVKHGKGLKLLAPKQMIQRLPIALLQVKASKTSEILLNEVRKIIYSLYQSKEITRKVYNNTINSTKL